MTRLIFLPLLLASCGASQAPIETTPEREACYLEARLSFHERASHCNDEGCIDRETENQRLDQEACK